MIYQAFVRHDANALIRCQRIYIDEAAPWGISITVLNLGTIEAEWALRAEIEVTIGRVGLTLC